MKVFKTLENFNQDIADKKIDYNFKENKSFNTIYQMSPSTYGYFYKNI